MTTIRIGNDRPGKLDLVAAVDLGWLAVRVVRADGGTGSAHRAADQPTMRKMHAVTESTSIDRLKMEWAGVAAGQRYAGRRLRRRCTAKKVVPYTAKPSSPLLKPVVEHLAKLGQAV